MSARYDIYHRPSRKPRVLDSTSLTVPDQTMPIRQILDRYARGIPIESPVTVPYYNEDEENPSKHVPLGTNYENLDLTDKQAIRDKIVEEMEEISTRVQKTREMKEKARLRAELDKEMEEQKAKLAEKEQPPAAN